MTRSLTLLVLVCTPLAAQDMPPAPVETAPVVARDVAAERTFVGTVRPTRETTVGSEVEGLVEELLVEEGDEVEQGQPLARLATRTVDLEIAEAKAELRLRQDELTELKNGSRPAVIAEARAKLDEVRAEVELREWRANKAQALYRDTAISEDELKQARLDLAIAQQRAHALAALLELAEEGPRAEKIQQAEARVKSQELAIERLDLERSKHTIPAPFDGVVVVKRSEVGSWISKGDPIADVIAIEQVDVVVGVLEDYVGALRVGARIGVRLDALDDQVHEGELVAIVPRADVRARTFPVKIRLTNRRVNGSFLYKAGMLAHAVLAVGDRVSALLVPKDAIVLGGPQGPMVYVVGPESTALPVPVKVGLAHEGLIQVAGEGLVADARVVIRGNERLRPQQKVMDGTGR